MQIAKIFFAAFLFSTLANLTFTAALATAAVYHISPTGNDTSDGLSSETPLRTIQKASNISQAGDTIEILPGIYTEQITITKSGTQENPITYRAGPAGEVIIDGENTRDYCIKLDGADHIKIQNLTIKNSLKNGILIDNQASHNTITQNILYNNKESGIKITGQSCYNTISNNTLHHNTGAASAWGYRICAIYIFNYSNYNTITQNNTYNSQTGIWLEGWSSNCEITKNKTHDNSYGGIILVGETNDNTITNNLTYNNQAFGLELGYSAKRNLIKNNTIYNNQTNGIQYSTLEPRRK